MSSDLAATDRWWCLSDGALVDALVRVEHGEVSAAEAHALLLECSDVEDYRDGSE